MIQKIAIPVKQDGILDGHFGHCRYFAFFTVENGIITPEELLPPPPHEPGVLPRWLANKGVTDVIAGGMGSMAIEIFNKAGVNVFVGAPELEAIRLTEGFLDGSIKFTANYCNHGEHKGDCGNH